MVFPPSQKNLCQAQRDDKYFIILLTLILFFLMCASFRMQFLFLWYKRFDYLFALILILLNIVFYLMQILSAIKWKIINLLPLL